MKINSTLPIIKALTFDLDDTLYDNCQVVETATAASLEPLQQYKFLRHLNLNDFDETKLQLLEIEPDIYHDVVNWRLLTFKTLFEQYMPNDPKLNSIVDECMACFDLWRNKIEVPQETHDILSRLAEKYPLAIITNGNANIHKIGLAKYFQFSLRGGVEGRSKPFADLFKVAAKKLNLPIANILHVGDSLITDIAGARQAGLQACWLNNFQINLPNELAESDKPHCIINHLSQLNDLL